MIRCNKTELELKGSYGELCIEATRILRGVRGMIKENSDTEEEFNRTFDAIIERSKLSEEELKERINNNLEEMFKELSEILKDIFKD